jgi:lambda family phage portal protein
VSAVRRGARAPLRQRLVRSFDALLELMGLTGGGGASHSGAQVSRIHPPGPGVGGLRAADQEILWDLALLRARARSLRRNNAYIEHYVNLLTMNVLGPGGQPQHRARVRRPDGELDMPVNDQIDAAFREWAAGPVTADGKMNLDEFRDLQLETAAVDGEAFTRPMIGAAFPHGLALQGIDPDLVDHRMSYQAGRDGPEVRLGVEVDDLGRPLGYYAWDRPEYGPGSANRGRVRYPAAEILHHFRARRVNQTRGVSWLAAVILDLQDLQGFDEAVIVGARAGASQVGFVRWSDPAAGQPPDPNDPNAGKPVQMELNPGTVTELDPGQEFQGFTPEQPTAVYSPFVKTSLRRIAAGLGVSYFTLANDLESVNFTSSRAGSQVERDIWRKRQQWWIASFEIAIHRRWLQTAMLTGALQLPSPDWRRYAAVEVCPRGWQGVQPRDDAEAAEIELSLGLTSRTRIHAARGTEYREVLDELAQEQDAAAAKNVDVEPQRGSGAAAGGDGTDGGSTTSDGAASENGSATNGKGQRSQLRSALAGGRRR